MLKDRLDSLGDAKAREFGIFLKDNYDYISNKIKFFINYITSK